MSFTASPSKLAGPSVYVKYWGNNSVRVDGKLFKYSLSSIVSLNGELVSEAKDVKPGDYVVVKHVRIQRRSHQRMERNRCTRSSRPAGGGYLP